MRAKRKAVKTPRAQTTIMRVPVPGPRPWDLNVEQIDLLKKTICKGATDDELKLCLEISRRHKLDPFRGQIWFVPRKDDGEKKWVAVVGINGLLHIAARDHSDFGSIEEPEYGPMANFDWAYFEKKGTLKAPEWARVKVLKKGMSTPTVATVYFEEIYSKFAIGASPMVRQMPRHMLGKVATAHAVRKAWPATDGLYIREELQGRPHYTPEGRQINYPDAEEPIAAPLDENAAHGHVPGSPQAKKAEEALRRVEEADAALKAEREAIQAEEPIEVKPTPPPIPEEQVAEIWPKGATPTAQPEPAKEKSADVDLLPLVEGTITHSIAGMAGKIPVRDVTMVVTKSKKKPTFRCFDKKLFSFLDAGLGKNSKVFVKKNGKYWNLVGLWKIGLQEFEEGHIPVISVHREPGGSLFK